MEASGDIQLVPAVGGAGDHQWDISAAPRLSIRRPVTSAAAADVP